MHESRIRAAGDSPRPIDAERMQRLLSGALCMGLAAFLVYLSN